MNLKILSYQGMAVKKKKYASVETRDTERAVYYSVVACSRKTIGAIPWYACDDLSGKVSVRETGVDDSIMTKLRETVIELRRV